MRIGEKNSIRDFGKGKQPSGVKGTAGIRSLFDSELQLKQLEADNYKQDIEALKQSLNQAGERLEQEPTLRNFRRFRELLGLIAKQVSKEAYRLEKVGGTPTNPRYYEIITVIDKEADKLYQLIVTEQKDRMAITASVIGIKGLVVDLTT